MKIFINDITVEVLKHEPESGENIIQNHEFKRFVLNCLNNLVSENMYYLMIDSKSVFKKTLKNEFKVIKAAGGVVRKNNQILVIQRNGRWDIPKGKIEKGEKIKEAAVREVEEECGVKGVSIQSKLANTYHIYQSKNKLFLKKTFWFNMRCSDNQTLKAQAEEGITEVRWVMDNFFDQSNIETYKSIREIVKILKQA